MSKICHGITSYYNVYNRAEMQDGQNGRINDPNFVNVFATASFSQ